jgi:hypothetical protein
MLTRVAALALLVLPTLAAADPVDTPAVSAHATAEHRFALAVNQPFGWSEGNIGVSAYAGVTPHVAIRANLAKYSAAERGSIADIIGVLTDGDGGDASYRGGWFDVGVGAVWYPRALWSGFMMEAGILRRREHTHMDDDFADPQVVDRHITTYAGRVLGGWSWLIKDRAFIGLAVGYSYGRATGSEATGSSDVLQPQMTVVRPVSEGVGSAEGYLRFGVAF